MATKQGTTARLGPNGTGTLGAIGGLSESNTTVLSSIFPGSPVGSVDALNDDGSKNPESNPIYKHYISVARGTITGNSDFGDVDLTFNTANNQLGDKGPNELGEASTGAGGLPANAFVPNPTSPGVGEGVNPASMAAAPDSFVGKAANATPFNGDGSQKGVKESSAQQALAASTLGQYGLGSSPYGG